MKKLIPIFILSLFAFAACSDDDDKSIALSDSVVEFIKSKYNGADIRHAEYDGNGLIEVEILHDSRLKDVYFNSANEWVYTTWDLKLDEIPAIVKESLVAAYPDFTLDEADFIERGDNTYYEVDLKKGASEIVVFVSPEGVILDSSTGEPGTKPVISDAVRNFIKEKYPNATITDYGSNANGMFEVDIVDGGIEKDVYFDSNDNWVQTDWDVAVTALPAEVTASVASNYPEYTIDDAEYVERPEIVFYELTLEKAGVEQMVYMAPDGTVITQ